MNETTLNYLDTREAERQAARERCLNRVNDDQVKRDSMTPEQERHLQSLKDSFDLAMDRKYRAGVKEHNGSLMDVSERDLIEHAMEEVLDQFAYLSTLREKLRADRTTRLRDLMVLVDKEIASAVSTHRKFPTDLCRAMTILGEEYGEACKDALEIGRIDANVKDPTEAVAAKVGHWKRLKVELVQLMACAAMIITFNIDGGTDA